MSTAKTLAEMMKKRVTGDSTNAPLPPSVLVHNPPVQQPQSIMYNPPMTLTQQTTQPKPLVNVVHHPTQTVPLNPPPKNQQPTVQVSQQTREMMQFVTKAATPEQRQHLQIVQKAYTEKKVTMEQVIEEFSKIARDQQQAMTMKKPETITSVQTSVPMVVQNTEQQQVDLFLKFQSSTYEEKKILLKNNPSLKEFLTKKLAAMKKSETTTGEPLPQTKPAPMKGNDLLAPPSSLTDTRSKKKGKPKAPPKEKNTAATVEHEEDAGNVIDIDKEEENIIGYDDNETDDIEIAYESKKSTDLLSRSHLKNKLERVCQENGSKVQIEEVYEFLNSATRHFLQGMIEQLTRISEIRRRKFTSAKETSRKEFELFDKMRGVRDETIVFEKTDNVDKKKKLEVKDPKLLIEEEKKKMEQTTNILDMALGLGPTKKRKAVDTSILPEPKKTVIQTIPTSKYTIIADDIIKYMEVPKRTKKSKLLHNVLLKRK
jgi:hypothetical protein